MLKQLENPSPSSERADTECSHSSKTPSTSSVRISYNLADVSQLFHMFAKKIYCGGVLLKKNDRDSDGKKFQSRQWTRWYVELCGPVLVFYNLSDPAYLATANQDLTLKDQQQPTPPPTAGDMYEPLTEVQIALLKEKVSVNYINITDSIVTYIGSIKSHNAVFSLNSAGANNFYFDCSSDQMARDWVCAIRLASFEISVLHEIYTVALTRRPENHEMLDLYEQDILFQGYLKARLNGSTDWKKCWLVLTREETDVPRLCFYENKREEQPFATLSMITQCFSVYPETQEQCATSTIFKLEGKFDSSVVPHAEFVILMAKVPSDMLMWIVAIARSFRLYGDSSEGSLRAYHPTRIDSQLFFTLQEMDGLDFAVLGTLDARLVLIDKIKQKSLDSLLQDDQADAGEADQHPNTHGEDGDAHSSSGESSRSSTSQINLIHLPAGSLLAKEAAKLMIGSNQATESNAARLSIAASSSSSERKQLPAQHGLLGGDNMITSGMEASISTPSAGMHASLYSPASPYAGWTPPEGQLPSQVFEGGSVQPMSGFMPPPFGPNLYEGFYPPGPHMYPHDPYANPHQHQPMGRPLTLLEARDAALYMERERARHGPLVNIKKKETSLDSGLIGTINARDKQRAARKYNVTSYGRGMPLRTEPPFGDPAGMHLPGSRSFAPFPDETYGPMHPGRMSMVYGGPEGYNVNGLMLAQNHARSSVFGQPFSGYDRRASQFLPPFGYTRADSEDDDVPVGMMMRPMNQISPDLPRGPVDDDEGDDQPLVLATGSTVQSTFHSHQQPSGVAGQRQQSYPGTLTNGKAQVGVLPKIPKLPTISFDTVDNLHSVRPGMPAGSSEASVAAAPDEVAASSARGVFNKTSYSSGARKTIVQFASPTTSAQSSVVSQSSSSRAESQLFVQASALNESNDDDDDDDDNDSDNGDNDSDSDIPETMLKLFEQFAEQHLEVKPYNFLSPVALFNAYSEWCSSQQPPLKWNNVADEEMLDQLMEGSGYTKKQKSSEHAAHWYNVALHNTS